MAGSTTTYSGYNGLNLPASESVSGAGVSPLVVAYVYNALGQTTQMTRYADLAGTELVDTTTNTYDGDGRLFQTADVGPNGANLENTTYIDNGESQITAITAVNSSNQSSSYHYTYDPAGQLQTAAYSAAPWANENYAYDATGNRTQTQTGTAATDTLQTTTPTTTTGNQLQSDGTFIYQYDADGNLVTRTRISSAYASDATVVYSYDNQNRLSEVTNEDNCDTITQMVTYRYNAEGQRVSESVTAGGTTTVTDFFYDISGNLVLTTDGSGTPTGSYYYGQAVDQLLAQEDAAGNINWMITDREQSVREVVQYNASTGTSTVVDRIDYNSFGETISETNPSVAHVSGYADYINDLAIGMLETRSRYYDAPIGRFTSTDPSGFAGGNVNLYGYVNNSPVDMTDPSGLHPADPTADIDYQILTSSGPAPGMPPSLSNLTINSGLQPGDEGFTDTDLEGQVTNSSAFASSGGAGSLVVNPEAWSNLTVNSTVTASQLLMDPSEPQFSGQLNAGGSQTLAAAPTVTMLAPFYNANVPNPPPVAETDWEGLYQRQLSADAWATRGQATLNGLGSIASSAIDFVNPVSIYNDLPTWDALQSDWGKVQSLVSDPLQYLGTRAQIIGNSAANLISTPEGQGTLIAGGIALLATRQLSAFSAGAVGEAEATTLTTRVAVGAAETTEAADLSTLQSSVVAVNSEQPIVAEAFAARNGVLTGATGDLNGAERGFANELVTQGNDVEVVARGIEKTPDFLVNGVDTELKTLTTAGPNTLKNAVENASMQRTHIIVDARNVSITPQEALSQIQRADGNVGGLSGRVTVLTTGGTVKF